MTVLAELPRGLVSIQCDLCFPPVLTINTPDDLRRTGWALRSRGEPWDVCPLCSARVHPRDRSPRRDPEPTAPDPGRMPNVVIVGAMKAGTTSMHSYLALHPEVAASRDKELRFFQDPDCRTWIGQYQDNFATGTRYRVESTPFYSKWPCFPGVVDRMADLVPAARLIYLVRDPVERIVAEYAEQLQWRAVSRPLEVEVADADDPANWLVASSRYASQLREFQRRFDRDRITVIDLADLAADPAAVVGGVFDVLDLERPDLDAADFRRLNTRDDKRTFPGWVMALRRGPLVRALHRLPERHRSLASRLAHQHLRTGVPAPELSPRAVAALRESLQGEVDELRALTGNSFATWSV
jgi:hypothetical protein